MSASRLTAALAGLVLSLGLSGPAAAQGRGCGDELPIANSNRAAAFVQPPQVFVLYAVVLGKRRHQAFAGRRGDRFAVDGERRFAASQFENGGHEINHVPGVVP